MATRDDSQRNQRGLTAERLESLDAYRGLVMLLLAFSAVNWDWMYAIEAAYPDSTLLKQLLRHFDHVDWEGIVLWDMIQSSFMFMVGVSLAYSYGSRQRRGHDFNKMFGHAAQRALLLVLLGIFLRSLGRESTYWTLEDVVSQIGLGYVGLFLLWNRPWRLQLGCALGLLLAYWLLFACWPLPESTYDYAAVDGKVYYDGFFAHWNKNAHPGHYFDQWFLNLFPREEPFVANNGGYNTLNFVPSLSTMIFGLMAGEQLRIGKSGATNLKILTFSGIVVVAAGWSLHFVGACPIVKKVWTPSFGLVSTGYCLLTLALLYAVIDLLKWRSWSWPAGIVGRNSIAMYCMIYLIAPWILATLQRHFGESLFRAIGDQFQPLLENLAVGVCLWLICYWMHRREIFLRI
ncbi:MAG: DUF5009 domain-containing protein [Planctomycetota bacterium]